MYHLSSRFLIILPNSFHVYSTCISYACFILFFSSEIYNFFNHGFCFAFSLRKTLNINCQDENGNTALHLAALNGQRYDLFPHLEFGKKLPRHNEEHNSWRRREEPTLQLCLILVLLIRNPTDLNQFWAWEEG